MSNITNNVFKDNNESVLDKTNMPDYGDYGLSTKYEDNHPVANPTGKVNEKAEDKKNNQAPLDVEQDISES